jgi:hypothetical protein
MGVTVRRKGRTGVVADREWVARPTPAPTVRATVAAASTAAEPRHPRSRTAPLVSTTLSRRVARVAAALAVSASAVSAQVTVGTAEGGSALCVPMGCVSGNHTRYQQVYAASAFAGPIDIAALTFYHLQAPGNTFFAAGTFQLSLSTTSAAVGALSGTFDDNVGGDARHFATVTLAGSAAAPTFTISGLPFHYDPSLGNLLVDWRFTTIDEGRPWWERTFFDADYSGSVTSAAWDVEWVPGLRESVLADEALVTTFTATPEPATFAMLGLGLVSLGGALRLRRGARAG